MADTNSCPCGSQAEYSNCCKLFHRGLLPKNALLLMRSRYSAYARSLPDYIIETTHPTNPNHTQDRTAWKEQLSQFSKATTFRGLEILDFKENNTMASVTFVAYLSQQGKDVTFTERSYFEKIKKRWYYLGGHPLAGRVEELVTNRPLRLLPLAYYGDPILRRKSDPVPEIDEGIRKLAGDMLETMDAYDGIGISAPQVHQAIKLFVIRVPVEVDAGQVSRGGVKNFVNPTILDMSPERVARPEMCLSLPGINLMMERPKTILVEYTSLDGMTLQQQFSGWEAALIMHQYEHLEGVIFTDRLARGGDYEQMQPYLNHLEKQVRSMR